MLHIKVGHFPSWPGTMFNIADPESIASSITPSYYPCGRTQQEMTQPTSPLPSITVTPLANLIVRTAYHKLLDTRREPHHPEPTVLDLLVSVQGLTTWVLAQQSLREHHPHQSQEDIEAFLWKMEARRNNLVLTTRSLLDKSSKGWMRAQKAKEEQRRAKRMLRKLDNQDESEDE
jgi:hypothetical protein